MVNGFLFEMFAYIFIYLFLHVIHKVHPLWNKILLIKI